MSERKDYLMNCAERAVSVFIGYSIPEERYSVLLRSLFDDMEQIAKGITKEQIRELKSFGFDLNSMSLKERRSILFQMSLCRVLDKAGYTLKNK